MSSFTLRKSTEKEEELAVQEDPFMLVTSGCTDYDTEANERYYIRELVEDVDADHVMVTTHYGRLRGLRISGSSDAGRFDG